MGVGVGTLNIVDGCGDARTRTEVGRCSAREFASERVDADAFDAFIPPWPRITGVFGNDGAGDDASKMSEMGGMLTPCSRRSRPVLLGRLSWGAAAS